MKDLREKRAQLNIFVSFPCQIISIICGFIVPKLFIHAYGSEAYGTTASITQFLAYITLLEGGVGGVARAALYKPLAENNMEQISSILNEIKHFFRIIGFIFIGYVFFLACAFKSISNVQCFDWLSTFLLVIVISMSTFAQYFIGISYSMLIQAHQRQYITNLVNIISTVVNAISIVILVSIGCNLIIVKLFSSIIFVLRPLALWLYVKKHYPLVQSKTRDPEALSQKWTGLGQHIAFFLHSNTDISVLTVFGNQKMVAVYSIYYMVTYAIQNITSSFVTGMESMFGDMFSKKEFRLLKKTFKSYELIISMMTMILFGSTAVLIVPFVWVYTSAVTDANYIMPSFSFLLTIASALYCLRMPYHSMTIAAGHFKETKLAAYGEAVINIVASVLLVHKFELIGVAIGTVLAVGFRFLYYVFYLSKHIIYWHPLHFVKRMFVNMINFTLIYYMGNFAIKTIVQCNYYRWALSGLITGVLAVTLTLLINYTFYKKELKPIISRLLCSVRDFCTRTKRKCKM